MYRFYRFSGSIAMSVFIFLSACHTWEASGEPVPQTNLKPGANVRVHTANGARLEVRNAYVTSDSLIGLATSERIAISFGDIKRVDISRFSSDRTAAMVVAGVLAVPVGFVLLLMLSGAQLAPTF